MEDEEEVSVSVESTGLDVQEADEILEFDEVFALEVDFLGGKAFGQQGVSFEFMLNLGFPVLVGCGEGGSQSLVAASEALNTEKWVVLGLVYCKNGLALIEAHLYAFLLKVSQQFAELIAFEACFKPYLQVSQVFIKLHLFTKQFNQLLQTLCLDNLIFTLQYLSPELNSFVCPLLDGCFIICRLRVVEIFLLIVLDIMIQPHCFYLDLLDFQFEVSLLTIFGLGVLIDTGVFGEVLGEGISWFVVEVLVSFLIAGCLVQVALEFVVVRRTGAVNGVGLKLFLSTLIDVS